MKQPGATVWEDVNAGDVVLGHDRETYGVTDVQLGHPYGPIVTLYRLGLTVGPAQPPYGTPIYVVERADVSAEAAAFDVLQQAGLGPAVIRESYQP
jgi:hypothetical protein